MAAIDDKKGLATDSGVPWYMPSDSRRWKEMTKSAPNLMGYRSYQSDIINGKLKLNDRPIVVATNNPDLKVPEGVSLTPDALTYLQAAQASNKDVWIYGGARLFASTIQLADELYITRVEGDFKCTRFFPEFEHEFHRVKSEPDQHENGITFHYELWAANKSA